MDKIHDRMATLEARRNALTKQAITWAVVFVIPVAITLVLGNYFEEHLTFEEAYLNQTSKRADVAYGVGLVLIFILICILVAIGFQRNAVVKEIAEIDRIQSASQQADLIGAAIKGLENRPSTSNADIELRVEQLERISRLLADGTITAQEFERLKSDLFNQ